MITCNVPKLGKFIASLYFLDFPGIVSAATLAFIPANNPEAQWILGFAGWIILSRFPPLCFYALFIWWPLLVLQVWTTVGRWRMNFSHLRIPNASHTHLNLTTKSHTHSLSVTKHDVIFLFYGIHLNLLLVCFLGSHLYLQRVTLLSNSTHVFHRKGEYI